MFRPTTFRLTRSRHTRAPRALVFAVVCGGLLTPNAAHAQFGKLLKKAAQAAVEGAAEGAVQDKVAGAGQDAAAEPASAVRPRDTRQLDITAERLDAFVAAMRGPVEAARRRAAAAAALEEYEAKDKAYDACKDQVTERLSASPAAMAAMMEGGGLEKASRLANLVQPLMQRQSQAAAAGDTRLAAQLADSVDAVSTAMSEAQFPALAKACGRPPRKPRTDPADGDATTRSEAALRPAVPAGMTATQFGLLRERVAAWLVADGGGAVRYTDAERAALASRQTALVPLVPLFKGHTLEWRSWSDLPVER